MPLKNRHPQGLDAAGKAMFQMLGVFAEFERSLIRERVMAVLERAKAEGMEAAIKRLLRNVRGPERLRR
jgi:DNA invertase Pin-like site-specific DNA recombinase